MNKKSKSSKRQKNRAKNNPDIEKIIERLTAPVKTPLRVIGYIIDENGEKSDLTQNFY